MRRAAVVAGGLLVWGVGGKSAKEVWVGGELGEDGAGKGEGGLGPGWGW